MPVTVEQAQRLKRQVEDIRQQIARVEGALAEMKQQAALKGDEDSTALMTQLRTTLHEMERQLNVLLAQFKERYSELVRDQD